MGTDALTWYQVSAQGGHAGPGSTTPYINVLEGAMAEAARIALPQAWCGLPTCRSEFKVFPDIGEGVLGVRPPIPPRLKDANPPSDSTQVNLFTREKILWGVIDQQKYAAVASTCNVSEALVLKVLEEVVDVLVQLQLVKSDVRSSPRKHGASVSAFFLWARAARQVKFDEVSRYLSSQCDAGNWKTLHTLWQDWSLCRNGNFISLINPRPAARLTAALLEAGVAKMQMVVLSTTDSVPLSSQIKGFNIRCRACEPRNQRAGHRLFFVQHGVDAAAANAATLSMVGFHWWMLVLGSLLISRGEI